MTEQKYDVVIIGAGAAGLMCAWRAAGRGRKVLLLDRADRAGAKILIAGGGRCNFTNLNVAPDRYISENPHFCLSALKGYTPRDFIALVEKHGIAYHEKTLGQLFCDNSAKDIVAMLLEECSAAGVTLCLNHEIEEITKGDVFEIQTRKAFFEVPKLVLATGGVSIPKMGSTDFAHQLAQYFDLEVTDMRPGLVPLTFDGEMLEMMRALSGLSLEVVVACGKRSFRESMIFTHRGLSGPAILQISSYWREGQALSINLLPDVDVEAFLIEQKKARAKTHLKAALSQVLPARLAQAFAEKFSPAPIGEIPNKELKEVAKTLRAWTLVPSGTEGYDKAEVTVGGVSTHELSSKTMESKKVPGLYIIGEAVDVTGWLGGYNFQWAWSSGWAAGSSV